MGQVTKSVKYPKPVETTFIDIQNIMVKMANCEIKQANNFIWCIDGVIRYTVGIKIALRIRIQPENNEVSIIKIDAYQPFLLNPTIEEFLREFINKLSNIEDFNNQQEIKRVTKKEIFITIGITGIIGSIGILLWQFIPSDYQSKLMNFNVLSTVVLVFGALFVNLRIFLKKLTLKPSQKYFSSILHSLSSPKVEIHVFLWKRFFARSLDYFVWGGILVAILGYMFHDYVDTIFNRDTFFYWFPPIVCLSWVIIEAVLLLTWGTTLGKCIFNIKIRKSTNEKLNFNEALRRSILVCIKGMGINIPYINYIANAIVYWKFLKDSSTSWDREGNFILTNDKMNLFRISLAVIYLVGSAYLFLFFSEV